MNGSVLENASVDSWKINGDDNRNSKEEVLQRFPSGDSFWLNQRMLLWSTANSRWEYSDGSRAPVWTALNVSAGSTLDSAHTAGGTITTTNGTGVVGITDTQTVGTEALAITNTGVVPGVTDKNVVSITSSAVHTTSGTVGLLDLNFSGTVSGGTARGLSITMPAATDYALDIVKGSIRLQDGDIAFDDLALTGDITITNADATPAALTVTKSGVTTGKVVSLTANALTSGDMIYGESSVAGATTMKFLRFYDGAANAFDVAVDGATHIKGTAAATTALLVDAGDLVLTSGHAVLTSGNLTQTAGNYVNTLGNGTFTAGNLTLSAGVLTVTPAAVSTKGLVISGSGTRTVALEEFTASGTFNQPQVKWTASAAFTNDFFLGSVTGAGSGDFLQVTCGAVAYTGSLVHLDLGATSTTGKALAIDGGAAARTSALIAVTDASTGAAADTLAIASANTSATGALARFTESASYAGLGLAIVTDAAAVGAGALAITSATRAYTTPLVNITGGASNNTVPSVLVTTSATGAATTGNHGYSFVSSAAGFLGMAFKATLAQSTAASVLVGTTTGGSRTSNLIDLTDAGVGAGHGVSVTASGIGSGHLYYGTFSAAGTGNGLNIAMGSNVAGGGVVVTSAATTGVGLSVSHTGAFASAAAVRNVVSFSSSGSWDADTTNASYVLNVSQSTGAGATGDYAARISATGTNVEALKVDDGLSQFDEGVTIGLTGAGFGAAAAAGLKIFGTPATIGLYIDGTTAGNRPTQTGGQLASAVTTATASVVNAKFSTTTTGDQDGVVGVESVFVSGGLSTATKANYAFKATRTANASDAGYYGAFYAYSDATFGGKGSAFLANQYHDFTLSTLDANILVQPQTTSAGNGKTTTIKGGGANTAGDGGAVTISGGAALGAGNGGSVTINSSAGAVDGTVIIGCGGTTNKVTLNDAATAGAFGGINTMAFAASLRPTVCRHFSVGDFQSLVSASLGVVTGCSRKGAIFTDAAIDTDVIAISLPCTPDIDVSADMTVTLVWTGIGATDGTDDVAWKVYTQSTADNGDLTTSLSAALSATDTLSAVKQQERVTVTIAGATFTAGDLATIVIKRDGAAGADTYGQSAYLLDVVVAYKAIGLAG